MAGINTKKDLQAYVFSGISSVFAKPGGFTSTYNLEGALEFPVSDDSGFNFDTGAPSVEHFKIKGLNADWTSTFTPGDGELTLEIPCYETEIMKLCFGNEGTDVTVASSTNTVDIITTGKAFKGKGFQTAQKAIELGLFILDDTATKAFFLKKAKFMAQLTFDGSKPVCVTLTGSFSAGAEADAFAILELTSATL